MATVNEKMTAIADVIRDKTGGIEPLTLDGIAENIPAVYEAGKKAERNEFWKVLTNNGAKQSYYYTFSEKLWTKDNFKPTCNIVPTEAERTFYYHNRGGVAYDLAQQLEDCGVKLDMSNNTTGSYTFCYAALTRIPEIDQRKSIFTCMFRQNSSNTKLVTIDKIICSSNGDQAFTQTFDGCSKLKNVTFEGVIGRTISFSASPLSVESMKSIISCLKDYSGTENEGTYTVTFSSACKDALDAEGNTSPNGNTWREYASDLGWNC